MNRNLLVFLFVLTLALISCEKNNVDYGPATSLNVVTSVIGGAPVKLNSNVRDSAKVYNAKIFSIMSGTTQVVLYPANSPGTPYYNGSLKTNGGEIYSLFLTGQATSVEAILVKDQIPAYYKDSVLGIRFINLSPNSGVFDITLASSPSTKLFSSLSYKQLTNFIKIALPTTVSTNSVTFQVRDASNAIVASYPLPPTANSTYPNISVFNSRFRNLTMVIKGLQGTTSGQDAIGVFPVLNY